MHEAIIFDLDGTLVDTIADIGAAVNGALESLGCPSRTEAELRRLVGNGLRNLATLCLPEDRRDEPTVRACYERTTARYLEHPARYSRPYPGVPELLAELRRRSFPAGLLSNKADPITRLLVEEALPGHGLRAVQGERPGVPRKPDPTTALAMAAALGASPSRTVYLGDSDVDVRTAKAAGFFALGAAWGFRGREELEESGADLIIEEPLDVLAFLGFDLSPSI